MSDLNISIIYKKDNHWFTGTIKNNKLRKRKQIQKLSDATSKQEYVTFKRWMKENKIQGESSEYLDKFKIQSLYVKKEKVVAEKSDAPMSQKETNATSKHFWSKLNKICLECSKSCKQSSRVTIIVCNRRSIDK